MGGNRACRFDTPAHEAARGAQWLIRAAAHSMASSMPTRAA
jgi:hypothetical protein